MFLFRKRVTTPPPTSLKNFTLSPTFIITSNFGQKYNFNAMDFYAIFIEKSPLLIPPEGKDKN
jgi:hypothetical protein